MLWRCPSVEHIQEEGDPNIITYLGLPCLPRHVNSPCTCHRTTSNKLQKPIVPLVSCESKILLGSFSAVLWCGSSLFYVPWSCHGVCWDFFDVVFQSYRFTWSASTVLTVTHMPFSRHRRRYLVDSVSRHHDGSVVTEFSSLVMVEEFSCFVAVHSSPFVWFLVLCGAASFSCN